MIPYRDVRPIVGFSPVSACWLDGLVIEPPVCVPMLEAAIRPATAVAEPDDEPPGSYDGVFGVQALTVVTRPSGVVARVVASGPIWVLPRITAPASSSRATHVASSSGTNPSKMYEFAVVSTPL